MARSAKAVPNRGRCNSLIVKNLATEGRNLDWPISEQRPALDFLPNVQFRFRNPDRVRRLYFQHGRGLIIKASELKRESLHRSTFLIIAAVLV